MTNWWQWKHRKIYPAAVFFFSIKCICRLSMMSSNIYNHMRVLFSPLLSFLLFFFLQQICKFHIMFWTVFLQVHFRGYPANVLTPCEGEDSIKWSFINSLKEVFWWLVCLIDRTKFSNCFCWKRNSAIRTFSHNIAHKWGSKTVLERNQSCGKQSSMVTNTFPCCSPCSTSIYFNVLYWSK